MLFKAVLLLTIIVGMMISVYKYETKWKWLAVLLMPVYLYCIYLFTISGRVGALSTRQINLIPGESIWIMITSPWNNRGGYEFIEAVGNILMFVPLGIVLRKHLKCNYIILGISALALSLGIEYIQYYLMIGVFEIDDVINNIGGFLFGANIVAWIRCLKKKQLEIDFFEWIWTGAFCTFIVFALLLYFRFIITLNVRL